MAQRIHYPPLFGSLTPKQIAHNNLSFLLHKLNLKVHIGLYGVVYIPGAY